MASLCNDDREVVVLRCDSASKGKWTEHVQEKLDDKTLKVLIRGLGGKGSMGSVEPIFFEMRDLEPIVL